MELPLMTEPVANCQRYDYFWERPMSIDQAASLKAAATLWHGHGMG